MCFSDQTNGSESCKHALVGQLVMDELAVALGGDETRPAHGLQVLRNIGNRQAEFHRQRVDAAGALRQMLDQLQPLRIAERFGDKGKLLVKRQLGIAD